MACAIIQPSSVDLNNASSTVDATDNLTLPVGKELKFRATNVPANHSAARNKTIFSKNELIQLIPHFKQFLAFLIAGDLPEVRSVLMQQEGKLFRVFIVVDKYDLNLNERIYDREERIIDIFSEVDFDFHITCQTHISDPGLEVVR